MIIQKLRLENGWSQQQLSEMSGLSKRTIQRIENGKTPSVETVKSLAAVFEVDFSTLNGALTMNTEALTTTQTTAENTLALSHEEHFAYQKVRKVKRFYVNLCVFAAVITLLLMINLIFSPDVWWVQWVFLGWGLGLIIRGLKTFDVIPPLGVEWEQRQLDKYLKK